MLWLKAFHILFVMAWMAGLFYIPRILVHYVQGTELKEDTRRLVTMAGSLFRFSTVMSILVVVTGLYLWLGYGITGHWLSAKLALVVILFLYQIQSWRYINQMRDGRVIHSSLFFRIYNEAALIIVIPILLLVELKPF